MNKEKLNNWIEELKQKYKFKIWGFKLRLHKLISKGRIWIQEQIIKLLERIENWAHKKLDKIYDDIYDDAEPQIDDMIEGDTLG